MAVVQQVPPGELNSVRPETLSRSQRGLIVHYSAALFEMLGQFKQRR